MTDPAETASPMPLYVDLDHTLIQTDLAQEMLIQAGKSPITLLKGARAYLRDGSAALKTVLAGSVPVSVERLPYNPAVLEHIRQARTAGRRVVVATAANETVAKAVADHLGLFDDVLASTATQNLKGSAKLTAIKDDCHNSGFEYLGDSRADLPIWQDAAACGFAHIPKGAEQFTTQATLLPKTERDQRRALLKAMRPHQWAKNALLFVPLIFAHLYGDASAVLRVMLAFLSFGLCASAVYLINDLLDVDADRAHPRKCQRPFAAGTLPPATGVGAALVLTVGAFALAACVSGAFLLVLLTYIVTTKAYSLWLKQFSTIDVVVLALLYSLRILAGAAAISVMPSPWLLTFSLFFFLSLAYMKRYIESAHLNDRLQGQPPKNAPSQERLPIRNYYAGDLTTVQTFGIANGALSLLTLAEYVSSSTVQQRYLTPEILWLMLPVMIFWTYRAWMWANRDQIGDDPVAFALRDRISHGCVALLLLLVGLARYLDLNLPTPGSM
jgi:4-hydroxybenzoate polyprenyltransferase